MRCAVLTNIIGFMLFALLFSLHSHYVEMDKHRVAVCPGIAPGEDVDWNRDPRTSHSTPGDSHVPTWALPLPLSRSLVPWVIQNTE